MVVVTKNGYHHGDLRRALLEAGYALVRERGADEVRLREIARQVGVTPTAAYHHFPDREALVRAVAALALTDLADAITRTLRSAPAHDHRARLVSIGRAYVVWALDEPQLFRLAFGPFRAYPGQPVDLTAYALLTTELDGLSADGSLPPSRRADAEITLWSVTHGLTSLLVDGPLQPSGGRRGALRLIRSCTNTVLDGLLEDVGRDAVSGVRTEPGKR